MMDKRIRNYVCQECGEKIDWHEHQMFSGCSAYFTKFESGTNWCDGKIGKYNFQAKLFDEGSTFGIKDGRVSKLAIWDEEIRQKEQSFFKGCIVHYGRGWDIKSKKEFKPYFDAVMTLLENAPKRF